MKMSVEEWRRLHDLPARGDQEVIDAAGLPALLEKERTNKYGNQRVEFDGHTFDSKAEFRRYLELKRLEAAGEIGELEVHPTFELQESFEHEDETVRAIIYEADFAYYEQGRRVVEDVKGYETKVWRVKKKLFLRRYGDEYELRITEV